MRSGYFIVNSFSASLIIPESASCWVRSRKDKLSHQDQCQDVVGHAKRLALGIEMFLIQVVTVVKVPAPAFAEAPALRKASGGGASRRQAQGGASGKCRYHYTVGFPPRL